MPETGAAGRTKDKHGQLRWEFAPRQASQRAGHPEQRLGFSASQPIHGGVAGEVGTSGPRINTLRLFFELGKVDYKEPGFMKENGYGLALTLSRAYDNGVLCLNGEQTLGYRLVNYHGGTQESIGMPLDYSAIEDLLLGTRVTVGSAAPGPFGRITPYAGLGFRMLRDNLQQAPGGYRRRSIYLYSPLGVQLILRNIAQSSQRHRSWLETMIARFEYDVLLRGSQKSYLSDIHLDVIEYEDVVNSQRQGHGLAASVEISTAKRKTCFVFKLRVQYWDIRQSDTVEFQTKSKSPPHSRVTVSAYEPANSTTEIGVSAGIGW